MAVINTFFRNNALNRSLLTFFLVAVLTGCGGGSSDSTTGAGGEPSLVGTWTLSTIDGVAVPAGVATLTLTESTYRAVAADTAISEACTETGTYTRSGSTLTGTVSTASGLGCDQVGTTFTLSYTVTATTLTTVDEGVTGVYTRT